MWEVFFKTHIHTEKKKQKEKGEKAGTGRQ